MLNYLTDGCTFTYLHILHSYSAVPGHGRKRRRRRQDTGFCYKLPGYLTHGCTCKIGTDQDPRKPEPLTNIASINMAGLHVAPGARFSEPMEVVFPSGDFGFYIFLARYGRHGVQGVDDDF